MRHAVVLLVIAVVALSLPVLGQQIQAKIEVVLDKLPLDNQQKLQNLGTELDQYINNYQWCPDDYHYVVPVTVSVYFEEAKATSREDRYEARLIISNESDVQYSDYRWDFNLDPNLNLQHGTTYDPFTGMIDFYMYIIVAFEFDRLQKLGGNDYFQKARNVVEQAKFSRFVRGWDRREIILNETLSADNQASREMRFYYYTGIYYFDFGETTDAKNYLIKAISYFQGLPASTMERFYSLNYHRMGEVLKLLGMKTELELLMQIDPAQEHKDYYQTQWKVVVEEE